MTAIFDVSKVQQRDMAWQHTDDCPQSCHSGTVLGLSSLRCLRFPDHDFLYRRSSLSCMPVLFLTVLSRSDVFRTQYDSKGAVKPFGYMDGPWVLQQKASYAHVVSIVILDEKPFRVIFL